MKLENTAIRLKKIMQEKNLRQVDLLEMVKPFCKKYNVKINKSDISQYLSGKVKPGQEKLSMLSMSLGVTESWLMGYDVPMERDLTTNIDSNYKTTSMINYNLEQYIQNLGFNILADEEGYLILDTKDSKYEITLSDLESFENTTESFIKFKLSEIIDKSRKVNKVVELPKKEKQIWEEEKEYLMPIASHDKKGDFTEEDYKHDEDIMKNDDLWK
ncbi:MAG: hypothetical protein MR510_09480 [Clostridium sp.]|uniref:hypothetical protein n=1 Tax=Clostridium sp. TaxID=1506 RepID=UPI002A833C30|nr:hypothetical protein [Clostridium sp.]MCI6692684.1 hypothetical protein [Clostridium sp.]MDY4253805.1 hypothetical protein [Clostridium sp.]